jgi:integrase
VVGVRGFRVNFDCLRVIRNCAVVLVACAPIFASPRNANPAGAPLTDRAVNYMLKAAAERAGLPGGFSAHWLRHAHASHAIDHGAALPVVQSTLGHGNIAVTSGYLHARPGDSSGLHLDPRAIGCSTASEPLRRSTHSRDLPRSHWGQPGQS